LVCTPTQKIRARFQERKHTSLEFLEGEFSRAVFFSAHKTPS
jgi:hypothetical protein